MSGQSRPRCRWLGKCSNETPDTNGTTREPPHSPRNPPSISTPFLVGMRFAAQALQRDCPYAITHLTTFDQTEAGSARTQPRQGIVKTEGRADAQNRHRAWHHSRDTMPCASYKPNNSRATRAPSVIPQKIPPTCVEQSARKYNPIGTK